MSLWPSHSSAREDRHLAKARQNEQFAEQLDKTDATVEAWAVTAIFYAALHYVQAYLARHGSDCSDHTSRFQEIARDPKINRILGEYKYLYKLSHLARYSCHGFPDRAYQLAAPRLAQIKLQIQYAIAT